MEYYLVYVTAANEGEAARIATALVKKRLAACVNILPDVKSMFWWDEMVNTEKEVAFVAKTTKERFPAFLEEVKARHSYEVPCVVALPLVDGNPEFLQWIGEQTKEG